MLIENWPQNSLICSSSVPLQPFELASDDCECGHYEYEIKMKRNSSHTFYSHVPTVTT